VQKRAEKRVYTSFPTPRPLITYTPVSGRANTGGITPQWSEGQLRAAAYTLY